MDTTITEAAERLRAWCDWSENTIGKPHPYATGQKQSAEILERIRRDIRTVCDATTFAQPSGETKP